MCCQNCICMVCWHLGEDMQWESVNRRLLPPFHWVPEHDDEAGIGLQGVDEVLDEEGRLSLCGVIIEIHPGVIIPHGGRAGFSCKKHTHSGSNRNFHTVIQLCNHTDKTKHEYTFSHSLAFSCFAFAPKINRKLNLQPF